MPNGALRRLLFAQGGLCYFCKEPLPQSEASVEHLVASSRGGSDSDENCVACCKSLNSLLGCMTLKEKIQVFLNQKGQFECPNGAQRKVTKVTTRAAPKGTKLAKCYTEVIANLKRRGHAKPTTVVKLKSTVASLFPKTLSPGEVDTLIQQLQSRGVISIAESKVTYK